MDHLAIMSGNTLLWLLLAYQISVWEETLTVDAYGAIWAGNSTEDSVLCNKVCDVLLISLKNVLCIRYIV